MSNGTLIERLRAGASRLARAPLDRYADENPPLRSELFSADQMEQHGRSLAAAHRMLAGRAADRLLPRLADNERILVDVFQLLTTAVAAGRRITPAAEWLLDNFYLIEEQIRTAKRHLPEGYSRELPRLAHGPSARLPRVYDLAFEAIAHGDGRVDAESLARFVAAYQTVAPLTLGELWALPIMLRLALIENLRRVGARIAAAAIDRNRAATWADQMLDVALHDPKSLILVIADMARSGPPMVSSFVAELARRLQGQSAALALPLTWIEQRLSESATSIEQLVQSEAQEQAGVQVSISNTIGTLRLLGSMDWRDFVETMSGVERKLREDPAGQYGSMDFATRDRYRHVVEEIAKGSDLSESDVARTAIRLAFDSAAAGGADERAAHVGFFLIDKGRPRLEQAARMRVPQSEALRRAARRFPLLLYVGAIATITTAVTAALLATAAGPGVADGVLVIAGALLAVGASQLAVGIVNWLITLEVTPHPLAMGKDPWQALYVFFIEPIDTLYDLGELMLKASPIMLCAVGLAVGYRANVWNIGAEGQLIMGAIFGGGAALAFHDVESRWVLPAMLVAGMAGGMLWAAIPALLRTRFNANEILVSLMLVYVASLILSLLVHGAWRDPEGFNFPQSKMFADHALLPNLLAETRLNVGLLIALAAVAAAWLFMHRSLAGYQMRVAGLAPAAANYAGISSTRTVWMGMLIGGGCAGLAGIGEVAGPIGQLLPVVSPGYGFAAIIVAFVGRLHPVGIFFASLLMSLLYLGGEAAQMKLALPSSVTGLFQGTLLLFLLASDVFIHYRLRIVRPVSAAGTA